MRDVIYKGVDYPVRTNFLCRYFVFLFIKDFAWIGVSKYLPEYNSEIA